ncbi:MAG: DUF4249 family protein [Bacteroidota bacterium]
MKTRLTSVIYSLAIGFLLMLNACTEDFEVNAPYQDIWAVYGVLNQNRDVQTIRVSKAFQPESNAFTFARENDLSVKGLQVQLLGNGKVYMARQVDNLPKDSTRGTFFPTMTAYQFDTHADDRLVEGEIYTLEIRDPADSSLFLSAQTRIPPQPELLNPTIIGRFTDQCLIPLEFEDSVQVIFKEKRKEVIGLAAGYEVSVNFSFTANGQDRNYQFGPTKIFDESTGCGAGGTGVVCYEIGNGAVMRGMQAAFRDTTLAYSYQAFPTCGVPGDLTKAIEVRVTAVDTFLTRYILANNPAFTSFNTVRREYTNVSGTERAVGIFGSVAFDQVPVSMTACGEYLLGLNPFNPPGNCN